MKTPWSNLHRDPLSITDHDVNCGAEEHFDKMCSRPEAFASLFTVTISPQQFNEKTVFLTGRLSRLMPSRSNLSQAAFLPSAWTISKVTIEDLDFH